GAALVSILSFVSGRRPEAAEVERLEVTPAVDTAFALGDTLRLTVMAADARGVSVVPSRLQWETSDSAVALVDSGGRVQALRRGQTLVTVAAGGRIARARVWVLPRVAELIMPEDSVIRLPEGRSRRLQAVARDARLNRIPFSGLRWTVADEAVAAIDSNGDLRALSPGATTVSATLSDLLVQRRVEVSAVPASLTLGGGGAQRAPAGERLAAPLSVQVVSRGGRPVPQVPVRFMAAGGGTMTPDTAVSDSAGVVRARWTLGPRPGRQQALVTVMGVDSPLVVAAEADPLPAATRITILPDSLSGRVLETLAQPVLVELTDSSGVALPDVPVEWRAMDGGEVVAVSARTDSLGQAQGRWTLGRKAGPQRLHIQVGNPKIFPHEILTAEALPAPAARLELVSGNNQKGTAGKALPRDVVLRVTDSLGNPVADAPVRFHRTGGPAKDSVIRSGSDGRVEWGWILTRTAGPDRLTAHLGKGDSVSLAALARPGPADTVRFLGAPATAVAGKALPKPFEIRVADRYGNPVPGASVRLAATAGRLSAARVVTDSQGKATVRWTPGSVAGRQTVSATVTGADPAKHAVQVSAPPRTSTASRPRSTRGRTR
ncbi:MAG TPA: Ig-like domain-containing protein, partial [Gemmatimonadales bacterium]|nr:Ig-like domain-containing protein [Gemmatimonadales bacterium]